ncbi:LytR family transcriptional attenuator [Krasilnikovia cinnamomea]|uniref:LytR family transcriptional attenuator n=2 Tax=Krasilnikovia cinnamomea TaxID=349313 RepID=A0A4Q7ZP02_9ACTN|nr:LytR family transcriptional attenuator [Krasilnikovia cinnamomea]
MIWTAAVVAFLVLAGGGVAYALHTRTAGSGAAAAPASAPPSAPATAAPSASAPEPGAGITGPLDLLLLGVDTRVSVKDWQPHSDTIMLLHLERGLDHGYLYSLPRDLRVDIPAFPKSGFKGGRYKITEAMSRGARVPGSDKANVQQGYELLAKTISAYTGIKTFHAGAVLTFGGLEKLTDALGGVTLTIDQKVVSIHRRPDGGLRTLQRGGGGYVGPQAVYKPGTQNLVGWQAIDYARQRYGLKGGDYDRGRHQRQLVRALLTKALDTGVGTDPAKLQALLTALGDSLVYVGGKTPLEYASALSNLKPDQLTLVGLPGDSVGSGGRYLGEQLLPEGRGFLKAVTADQVGPYLTKHPDLIHR